MEHSDKFDGPWGSAPMTAEEARAQQAANEAALQEARRRAEEVSDRR